MRLVILSQAVVAVLNGIFKRENPTFHRTNLTKKVGFFDKRFDFHVSKISFNTATTAV